MFLVSLTSKPVYLLSAWNLSGIYEMWVAIFKAASLDNYYILLGDPYYLRALVNSLFVGVAVTVGSLLLGVPMAYGVSRTAMPFKNLVRVLTMVPLMVPDVMGAIAFIILLGPNGMVPQIARRLGLSAPFDLYSSLGLVLVEIFHAFPFVFFSASITLENIGQSCIDASKTLRAKDWYRHLTVTLPLATPGIAAGLLTTFVIGFTSFGAAMILNPPRFPLLAVAAYSELIGFGVWGTSAMMTMVIAFFSLLALTVQKFYVERRSYTTITGRMYKVQLTEDKKTCYGLLIVCLLALFVPLAELGALVLMSFSKAWAGTVLPTQFTLENYDNIFSQRLDSLLNTFILCGGAAILATILGTGISYVLSRGRFTGRGVLDYLSMTPFGIPGVVFGIAYLQTFNSPPIKLTMTPYIVIIAYAMRRLPYVVRSTTASLQQLSKSLDEASLCSGATRMLTMMKVVAPLIWPGILMGAVLTFIRSAVDVGSTIFLAPAGLRPLCLEVFMLGQELRFETAAALSVVGIALIAVIQLLLYRKVGKLAVVGG
jgi:iron(III) transport system permease protein